MIYTNLLNFILVQNVDQKFTDSVVIHSFEPGRSRILRLLQQMAFSIALLLNRNMLLSYMVLSMLLLFINIARGKFLLYLDLLN